MTHHAYERVRNGNPMPGVFEVDRGVPVAQAIEDILLLAECSLEEEWEGQVRYLPLRWTEKNGEWGRSHYSRQHSERPSQSEMDAFSAESEIEIGPRRPKQLGERFRLLRFNNPEDSREIKVGTRKEK